ncbi:MAG: thiamine pyrophosphate-binding protein [Nitrososphaerota archaeon]
MKGGKIFAEAMKAEGVRAMYGVPGHAYLGLIDALTETPEIRYVLFRHEEGAAIAAGIHSRLIGFWPVMAAGTCGPGVAHLINGAYGASQEGWPVVFVGGQIEARFLMKGGLQEAPHVDYLKPITKWAVRVEMVWKIPEIVRNAVKTAVNGIPGPVYIDFPLDMQFEQIEMVNYIPSVRLYSAADAQEVKGLADLLIKAERPVILAGSGSLYNLAGKELVELADLLKAPLISTPMVKGIVPEDLPLYAGLYGSKEADQLLSAADVIFLVGVRRSEVGKELFTVRYPAKLAEVSIIPSEIGSKGDVVGGAVGTINLVLKQLIDVLRVKVEKGRQPPAILAEIQKARKEAEELQGKAVPMHPSTFLKELERALPDDTICLAEAGQVGEIALRVIKARHPNFFIKPSWPSATGTALPGALGAKLALPDRPVVAICGDSGFVTTCRDFEVATRERLGIAVFILNNNEMAAQRLVQEERFGRSIPMNTGPFDYVKFGEAFNVFAGRVERPSELPQLIRSTLKAAAEGMPAILEAPVKTVKV